MTDAAAIPQPQTSETLDLIPRIGHFLEEYGEIATILPVLAGLFVTSRLQLRGASALLANLAIAALIRQGVIQLKKQSQSTPTPFVTDIPFTNSQHPNGTAAPTVDDYTIVHSTLGRIRLRIPRITRDSAYAKRLEKLLRADERVNSVRLNRAAASLVIHYDGVGVSELELGMRLLQILEQAETLSSHPNDPPPQS
ncbi:HMA2 domain-containing protein [Alkalinema pantanalense CENA528]|uniref:HMA2 domain-containing protein n=1 Tax=Alkalinema pantanalense TaxID=1620705 RepID=UPI003D701144